MYTVNYRIPDIKEFIKGFEYEVYSEGFYDDCIEDFEGWYRYKFKEGICWRTKEDIKRELKNGYIRCTQ